MLPSNAFYRRGDLGAKVILTDNSPPERNALHIIWPEATLLLCIVRFLQSRWDAYDSFVASKIVSKYPHLLKYFEGLRSRKSEWALALRKHLMLRGNNTKNISEAGIRILKEIIFQRVQAFNLVQIFDFITITLEMFFRTKAASYCPPPTRQPYSSPVQGDGNKQAGTAFITTVEPKKRSLCSKEHLKEKNVLYC